MKLSMRPAVLALALTFTTGAATLAPLSAGAQTAKPGPEVGFRSGWARTTTTGSGGKDTEVDLAIPGAFYGPMTGVHLTWFLSPRYAIEPQFGFRRLSAAGATFNEIGLAAQGMAFLGHGVEHTPYVFLQAVTRQTLFSGGGTTGQSGGGVGIGYRQLVRKVLGLRYELRYQHRGGSGDRVNEIAVLFGIGAVLHP